jgi:bifunctional NMN adenylyltransferase/nudix hydrolase
MAKTRVGVVIGRFQVPKLSDAHIALISAVLAEQDSVAVLLGVSPTDGRTAENPLTFVQRQELFSESPVKTLLPIADRLTDEEWSRNVDMLLQTAFPLDRYVVTLYGGRKSFRASYRGNYLTKEVELNMAESGTDVRAAVKERQTPDFLKGQVYALQTQFPKVYPTVDCIVWRDNGQPLDCGIEVLLIRRTDNGEWGFIGGFVDPQDESYAAACKREVYEEVGLTAESGVVCVGSVKVNDWRYRGTRDAIMTTLFTMQYAFGPVKVNPEEVQDYQWVSFSEIGKHLSKTHSPLWRLAADQIQSQIPA